MVDMEEVEDHAFKLLHVEEIFVLKQQPAHKKNVKTRDSN